MSAAQYSSPYEYAALKVCWKPLAVEINLIILGLNKAIESSSPNRISSSPLVRFASEHTYFGCWIGKFDGERT